MKKAIAIGVAIAGMLLGAYYFVYQTDYALLGDEFCLNVASNDVLGNPLYGPSCPRSSYASNVESLHTADKAGAAFFKFTPIAGKEDNAHRLQSSWIEKQAKHGSPNEYLFNECAQTRRCSDWMYAGDDSKLKTVQIFKGFGFTWGGDWPKPKPKTDRPHFQRLPPGQ